MSKTKLKKIQNISRNDDKKSYKRRLTKLRDKNLISDQNIATLNGYLREHVIDPDTYVIRGTLGAKREQRNPFVKKCEGYHLYNDKTRVVAFYDLNDRNLRTFMAVKQRDRTDLLLNGNLN